MGSTKNWYQILSLTHSVYVNRSTSPQSQYRLDQFPEVLCSINCCLRLLLLLHHLVFWHNYFRCVSAAFWHHNKKISPTQDWWSTPHIVILFQAQRHVTQKLGKMSKTRPVQIQILCSSSRISSHLPASSLSGAGDRTKKEEFLTLKVSRPWPWIGSYGIPSCSTHQPLPIYQISFEWEKLFVDRRMDGNIVHMYRR